MVRIKEADQVKITKFPRIDQLRAYKNHVRQEVVAASGRGDDAFTWIQAVEKDEATFENLGKSGKGYETLDAKLASAMVKTCDGSNLARDITAKTEQEAKESRVDRFCG